MWYYYNTEGSTFSNYGKCLLLVTQSHSLRGDELISQFQLKCEDLQLLPPVVVCHSELNILRF